MGTSFPRIAFISAVILGFVSLSILLHVVSHRVSAFSGSESIQNSQTVSLLEPRGFIDNKSAQGGGDIVVENDTLVPESGPAGTSADLVLNGFGSVSLHQVRPGETLSQIASLYQVSVNTVRWANGITAGEKIQQGQTLLILPMDGLKIKVASGETVASLAKKYGGDEKEIRDFNALSADQKLAVGQEIVIPGGEMPQVVVKKPTKTASTKSQTSSSVRPQASSGYYDRPISGRLTQGYHGRYRALDYGAPVGTSVFASAPGTVIASRSGWNGGYGTMIIVSHNNGTQTLYAHLSKLNVSVGQQVSKGQAIGLSGNTGRSTGPHLHFEIRGGIDIPKSLF
ncbi:MAG: LysM peptidoglycan-binding domain-containing M23 family metallopeptidase [Candidatus Pacebacteria bacterium]|nr:LysM peptidoglycan-binding domain-containing M23 family metallopeptidase [Candidatus Paceibacterota bacterium]